MPDAAAVAGVDRTTLLLKSAAAAGNSGEFRHALALARAAVAASEGADDPLLAAAAHERLGEPLYQTGDMEETLASFRRAADLVPTHSPSALRARASAGLARALVGARLYEEARRWCEEALAVAREADAAEEETHALITLAVLEQRHNHAGVARSLLHDAKERAAAAGARAQELRAQYSLGALELDIGDLPAAAAMLEEAVAVAQRTGLEWSQYGINARALRLFAYYAAGDWDEAERLAVAVDDHPSDSGTMSAAALFVEVGRGLSRAA